MQNDDSSKVIWFLAGAAIGATITLLYTPYSGRVTRRMIGRRAAESREKIVEASRDVADRGKDIFEKGRKIADEAAELFERGRKMVEG